MEINVVSYKHFLCPCLIFKCYRSRLLRNINRYIEPEPFCHYVQVKAAPAPPMCGLEIDVGAFMFVV